MSPALSFLGTITQPVAIGIGLAALVVLFAAFKLTKLAMKLVMILAALVALGLAGWWYFTAHHG